MLATKQHRTDIEVIHERFTVIAGLLRICIKSRNYKVSLNEDDVELIALITKECLGTYKYNLSGLTNLVEDLARLNICKLDLSHEQYA